MLEPEATGLDGTRSGAPGSRASTKRRSACPQTPRAPPGVPRAVRGPHNPLETIVSRIATAQPVSTEAFVTTEDVAAFLGKPPSWLYNRADRLGIPRYRVGQQYRYRISEVAAWVQGSGAAR